MLSLPDLILPTREFFGLSIDRMSLRGVQINRAGKVKNTAEVQIPQDLFSQSVLVNGDIFKQALLTLREKGKFTTPYVVVSFPEAFAYSRELTLPKVALSEIGEAVSWHVKELFPFPEEELYIDWKLIREQEGQYIVSIVGVPKKTIDPIVNILLNVGLKPMRLKPDASTIAHLLQLKPNAHALVTEVNRTGAYVTLVEGEKSVFTTVISFSKEDTPVTYLTNIKQTIQEIIAYYKQRSILKEDTIPIILTGEVASDHWVKEMPQPTTLLVTPMNNPSFNKAYASALSQVTPISEHDLINILPPNLKKVYDTERTSLFYTTVLTRTVVIIGAYTVLLALVLALLVVEKQQIDTNVKRLNDLVQSQSGSAQALLTVNGTAKQIVALAPFRKTPRIAFMEFLELVPSEIAITQWNFDDSKQQFSVNALANTRDDVLNFKTVLEESNKFTNIVVPLSFLESPRDISFTMTFTTKQL